MVFLGSMAKHYKNQWFSMGSMATSKSFGQAPKQNTTKTNGFLLVPRKTLQKTMVFLGSMAWTPMAWTPMARTPMDPRTRQKSASGRPSKTIMFCYKKQ